METIVLQECKYTHPSSSRMSSDRESINHPLMSLQLPAFMLSDCGVSSEYDSVFNQENSGNEHNPSPFTSACDEIFSQHPQGAVELNLKRWLVHRR